jgi:FSR family fosmidomycin resistance protein-like MFS transporter
MPASKPVRFLAAPMVFTLTLLLVEFVDELSFGAREAAWPLIRTDLGLSYTQIGILLALPNFIASILETGLDILADIWNRRLLILGGGIAFILALVLVAQSQSFAAILIAYLLFNPASGAFVSLSQAALMDAEPERREQNMARWTFAGSLGVVAGPLALGAAIWLGGGWRPVFLAIAILSIAALLGVWRFPFPAAMRQQAQASSQRLSFGQGVAEVWAALKRPGVLRWLALLECSDLMLDVLLGFLALYLVDISRATPEQAGLAVAVWSGFGLLGDFLLIPLLERIKGLAYLRISALVELFLFLGFLLVPGLLVKIVLLGLLGFFNSGWYSVLMAQLYGALPGRSGISLAVNNISSLAGSLIPFVIGLVAQRYNLSIAMWLLLVGPVALLLGLPRTTGLHRSIE